MAMAKKGTRRITIDGVRYRWLVAPNDGYMVLKAELADAPGQRLECYFRYHDVHEPAANGAQRVVGQRRSLTPRVARAMILTALAGGWKADKRGLDTFRILDADEIVPLGLAPHEQCR